MKHPKEAAGELVVAGRDGAIDLEPAEGALDAVAQAIELPAVADRLCAVSPAGDHWRDAAGDEVVADRVAVVALVGDQRAGRVERQRHQRVVALAVRRFAAGEVEAERSAAGVTDTMNLTGEPAPRAAKRLFASPPFAPAADTWPRTVVESML